MRSTLESPSAVSTSNSGQVLKDYFKSISGTRMVDGGDSMSPTGTRINSSLLIWTPRATLRLGMLLRDSAVARKVRSVILDIVQESSPSVQPEPASSLADLSVLTYGELKRLFYYRKNIESQSCIIQELVKDIDPVFWEADLKSVAIAFEEHCLHLEENYLEHTQQSLKMAKRSIRLRKKYLVELVEGQTPQLLPDFGRHYPAPIFELGDCCIL